MVEQALEALGGHEEGQPVPLVVAEVGEASLHHPHADVQARPLRGNQAGLRHRQEPRDAPADHRDLVPEEI